MKAKLLYILGFVLFQVISVKANDMVRLVPDRTLYLVEENIYFSGLFVPDQKVSPADESKVVYVEIIDAEGKSYATTKCKITSSFYQGSIDVPPAMESGVYYLRAYTRWQRNFSPKDYAYVPLRIINYLKPPVKVDGARNFNELAIDSGKTTVDSPNLILPSNFGKREQAVLKIKDVAPMKGVSLLMASVSFDKAFSTFIPGVQYDESSDKKSDNLIPDTREISISGKVVSESANTGMKDVLINLTIIGENDVNYSTYSLEDGRFYISLPEYVGRKEVFISASYFGKEKARLFIDNDFCTKPVRLETINLVMDSSLIAEIKEMDLNRKIVEAFYPGKMLEDTANKAGEVPFYGAPDKLVKVDDFILLPTLEDYFMEFFPYVALERKKDEVFLRTLNQNGIRNIYEPLILIDGIALGTYQTIWDMKTAKLKSIEAVNEVFYRGDVTYGGIIHIKTKAGDYGGISLPENGLFIDYQYYTPQIIVEDVTEVPAANLPVAKNTLLWIPQVKISDHKEIPFVTGDFTGNFKVVLTGIKPNGEVLKWEKHFQITE